MFSIITRLYRLFFVIVLITLLTSIALFSNDNNAQSYPQGKKIDGEIQFDSVLTLNAPLSQTKTALFVRYYVSENAIAYHILWAEPAWMAINYPFPPFDLACYIDSSRYNLFAAPSQQKWNYSLDNTSRDIFSHMLNSYAVDDQRFAFTEYMATRTILKLNSSFTLSTGPNLKEISQQQYSNYSIRSVFSPNKIKIIRTEKYGPKENNLIVSEKQINYASLPESMGTFWLRQVAEGVK